MEYRAKPLIVGVKNDKHSQGRIIIIHDLEDIKHILKNFIFFILVVFSTSFCILAVAKLKKLNMIV